MGFLSEVTSGIVYGANFNIIAGSHGMGKTTLACQFPSPIVFDLENGSKGLNVKRIASDKFQSLNDLYAAINELKTTKHDFKTLVIDSMVKVESLIHKHLCGSKYSTIEEVGGGFGKGFTQAREEALRFVDKLIELVEGAGMEVNLIAHTQVKKQADPYDNTEYDRYILQGNEKFTQIFESQAYNVYFIKRAIYTELNKNKKTVALFDGQRIICAEWRPGFSAKNRLNLPPEIFLPKEKEKAYETLKKAILDSREKVKNPEDIISEIEEILVRADKEFQQTARTKVTQAEGDIQKLLSIKAKCIEVVKF